MYTHLHIFHLLSALLVPGGAAQGLGQAPTPRRSLADLSLFRNFGNVRLRILSWNQKFAGADSDEHLASALRLVSLFYTCAICLETEAFGVKSCWVGRLLWVILGPNKATTDCRAILCCIRHMRNRGKNMSVHMFTSIHIHIYTYREMCINLYTCMYGLCLEMHNMYMHIQVYLYIHMCRHICVNRYKIDRQTDR